MSHAITAILPLNLRTRNYGAILRLKLRTRNYGTSANLPLKLYIKNYDDINTLLVTINTQINVSADSALALREAKHKRNLQSDNPILVYIIFS